MRAVRLLRPEGDGVEGGSAGATAVTSHCSTGARIPTMRNDSAHGLDWQNATKEGGKAPVRPTSLVVSLIFLGGGGI